jgi:hypothetical protein
MEIAEAIAFLGVLMLSFFVCLFGLSAYSEPSTFDAMTVEARRSRQRGCLILLNFLMLLAMLVWRSS